MFRSSFSTLEYRLVAYLMHQRGQVVPQSELVEHVYGPINRHPTRWKFSLRAFAKRWVGASSKRDEDLDISSPDSSNDRAFTEASASYCWRPRHRRRIDSGGGRSDNYCLSTMWNARWTMTSTPMSGKSQDDLRPSPDDFA